MLEVIEQPVEQNTDTDRIHLVCGLHSPNIALCGEDVSGTEWGDGDDATECQMCVEIDDSWRNDNSDACPECRLEIFGRL